MLLLLELPGAARADERPEVVWQVGGHAVRIHDAVFSPDGNLVATASEDGTAKLWRTSDGRLLRTFTLPTGNFQPPFAIYGVSFSPDGQELWGASVGASYAWRISDGTFVTQLGLMESTGQTLFSPDGTMIAVAGSPAGSEDATHVFRRSDGALLHAFEPAGSLAAVFTHDSEYLLAGTTLGMDGPAGVLRWYRLSDGALVRTLAAHTGAIQWLALSPDGTVLASCGNDDTIKLWNAADGSLIRTLAGHSGDVFRVRFSPDGARLASSSRDGTIRLWDAATGEQSDSHSLTGEALGAMDWSPDGATLLAASGQTFFEPQRGALLIDAATGNTKRVLTELSAPVADLALSPDGERFAVFTYFNGVEVRNTADGSRVWSTPSATFDVRVAFTSDGSRLAAGESDGVVRFFDASTGDFQQTIQAQSGSIDDIAFSSDGQTLITRNFAQPGRIWNYPALTLRSTIAGTQGGIATFAFTHDGLIIISAGSSMLAFSSAADGGFIQSFVGHSAATRDVSISADGARLASASADRTARIWDVSTGATLHTLAGFQAAVDAVAISRDGRTVVTGTQSLDRDVRIWHAGSGGLVARYTVDTGTGATRVAMTPDDRHILYARRDGCVVMARNPLAIERGDIDGNAVIDANDAAALAAVLLGAPLDPEHVARADVNGDGRLDGRDVAAYMWFLF